MFSQEIATQLAKFANSNMRMARKETDGIIIARTRRGNVDLTYSDGIYKLEAAGEILYEGKAKGCREAIVSLYDIDAS